MTVHFGRETRIKLVGGELIYKEAGASLESLRARLEGVKRRALNLRSPFESFRSRWQEQIREVFAREGLPQPWPPLDPDYAAWKRRRFPGKTMMRRSDRLFLSLTEQTRDTIWEATPRTIRFGTRVPYFRFHQDEGARKRRPTLVLLPETFEELNRVVMGYVSQEGLRGSA